MKQGIAMARIILDPSNAKRDYYIPLERAKELYDKGKLQKCSVYKDQMDYCTPIVGVIVR